MSADTELLAAYQEWQRCAETERDAIRARDWPGVARCQETIQRLQGVIPAVTEAARHEWSRPGTDRAAREKEFQNVVAGLIEIESSNRKLLSLARESVRVQLHELDRSTQNLKRLQQSYAPARRAGWTSFFVSRKSEVYNRLAGVTLDLRDLRCERRPASSR